MRMSEGILMATQTRATIEDLYAFDGEGKAELVNGALVVMSPSGDYPVDAATAIVTSLRMHQRRAGGGRAYSDGVGYLVQLPNRQSFTPDASWYVGPRTKMKFLNGPPALAVEVRSEHDYGRRADRDIAAKRADYFAAGTAVVWDVDLLSEDVVRVYRSTAPDEPTIYRRGDTAEADPAVPGWQFPVDELFE
jgi:Uma2 family endonuclease